MAKLPKIEWGGLPPWLSRAGDAIAGLSERWPALSLGLCGLLLLVLLASEVGFAGRLAAAQRDVGAAVDYAIHNPSVQIDPRLLPAVKALLPGFDGNEAFAFLRSGKGRERDALVKQQQADSLARAALRRVDAHPQRTLGLVPARPDLFDPLTYPLVHGGWLHGLATIALLLLLLPLLERTWSPRVVGPLLLASSLAAALVFALVHRGADRPLLGASVWVSALAAAVLVRFRGRHVDPLHWVPGEASLRVPFWAVAPAWIGYEVLAALTAGGDLPGGFEAAVPWSADLTGALVGVAVALAVPRFGLEERWGRAAPLVAAPRTNTGRRFDFDAVVSLRARGQVERAYAMLEEEANRTGRNRDAVVTYFQMSVERGEPERAVHAMRKLVAEELRRGAAAVAVGHWRTLCEAMPDPHLDPELLVRLIPTIREEDGDEIACAALRQATSAGVSQLPLAIARAVANLAADLDPRLAAEAARRALEAPELRPDEREHLEGLAAVGQASASPRTGAPGGERQKKLPKNVFYEEQDRSAFGRAGGELGELTAPGDEERLQAPPPVPAPPQPEPIRVSEAVPLALAEDALRIQVPGRGRARIPLQHVHAVAAAGVRGLGARPVVLIDLLVTGPGPGGRPRRVVRMRSDAFDPRPLAPDAPSPLAALRAFVAELARRAGADLLPDPDPSAEFATFDSLDAYTESVLAPQL